MESQEQCYDYQFKLILLGDSAVGKSCILTKYTRNQYSDTMSTTVGVEFASKIMEIEGKQIKHQIWDTAGQEKFKSMAKIYYKGAVGALLVYDITSRESFDNVQKWYEEIQLYQEKNFIVTILVGNKCDREQDRQVPKDEGIKWAEQNKIGFVETSAKDGTNIEFTFQKLVEQIYSLMIKKSQIQPGQSELNTQNGGGQGINGTKSIVLENHNKTKPSKDKGCC